MKIKSNYIWSGIVFALILLAVAVIGPMFMCTERASYRTICNHFDRIEIALKGYNETFGKYPLSLKDLKESEPSFIERIPKDPWENEYQYSTDQPSMAEYVLFTYGSDGQVGGEEESTDRYANSKFCN